MTFIVCPKCGKNVSADYAFCPYCGSPAAEVKDSKSKKEIERLLSKIKPAEFTCSPPRAVVCVKCGCDYRYSVLDKYHNLPGCDCQIDGHPYPAVEINFPMCEYHEPEYAMYVRENCVIPRNIGDENSDAYQKQTARMEAYRAQGIFPERPPKELYQWDRDAAKAAYERGRPVTAPQPYVIPDPTPSPTGIPKCPICGSTSLSRISTSKKVAKIAFFGLYGAGDIGKTWKCNNCDSRF